MNKAEQQLMIQQNTSLITDNEHLMKQNYDLKEQIAGLWEINRDLLEENLRLKETYEPTE